MSLPAVQKEIVVSYKNVAQRSVIVPSTEYFEWIQPLLSQLKPTRTKPRLQQVRPEDCKYTSSTAIPRFIVHETGPSMKVEIVESEVGITGRQLTPYGMSLISKDYHMNDLARFNDREGSYISILNECCQKSKNPTMDINPELNQGTSPPSFSCTVKANGNQVASVSGTCQTKPEAKNYVAKWLLSELYPIVHHQTERFFQEKKENLASSNPRKDTWGSNHSSIGAAAMKIMQDRSSKQTAPEPKPAAANGTAKFVQPVLSYPVVKTAEEIEKEEELLAQSKKQVEDILANRGGYQDSSTGYPDPAEEDSMISNTLTSEQGILLEQGSFICDVADSGQEVKVVIPQAHSKDPQLSKWGTPLKTVV
jgi:Double-stranded RNA binding motif